MAYMDVSTDFVCKDFHPDGSLLSSEDGKLVPERSPLLLSLHTLGMQLCWAVGSAPRAAEGGWPWEWPAAKCSTPCIAPAPLRCSFATSDVELFCGL